MTCSELVYLCVCVYVCMCVLMKCRQRSAKDQHITCTENYTGEHSLSKCGHRAMQNIKQSICRHREHHRLPDNNQQLSEEEILSEQSHFLLRQKDFHQKHLLCLSAHKPVRAGGTCVQLGSSRFNMYLDFS